MFKKLLSSALCAGFCVVFLGSVSSNCFAEQIVHNDSVPLSLTNWSETLTIPKFNPALGTLISVEIEFSAGVVGNIRWESLDSKPATIVEELSASVILKNPDLTTLLQITPLYNATTNAATFDGVIDFDGPSGESHPNVSANAADAKGPYSDDNAFFTGIGNIIFPVSASALSFISGADRYPIN